MRTGRLIHKVFPCVTGLLILLTTMGIRAGMTVDPGGRIDINIETEYLPQSLYIQLNKLDVTALAVLTHTGVSITPVQVLDAGPHTLLITFTSLEGYDIRQRVALDSIQDSAFYDGATGLGVTVRGKLYDKNDLNEQDYEVDAYLGHKANWRSESWAGDVKTDIWLFNRGTDIDPLEEDRPEIINYYASARHKNDRSDLLAEAGYIQLHESQNTIYRLARRGVHANYEGERLSLGLFTVNSQHHLGSEGGAGIGDGSDDSIVGFSTGWNAVSSDDYALKIKAIYSKGAEDGDSLGILSNNTASEGHVAALLIESKFNRVGLNIEAEFDQSSFDADTGDAIAARDDDAYALRIKGNADWVSYRAAYERIGAHYAVVANPLLQNDREYVSLSADFDRGEHGFALNTQLERDNLNEEAFRARLNRSYLAADYRYRKGRNFSTLISLQNNRLISQDEPTGSDILDTKTNSVLGRINLVSGRWNNLISFLFSDLDDTTITDNDSEILSYTISPGLLTDTLNFTPSYSNTTTEFNSGQKIRQGIFSVHIHGKAYDERLDYQLSASFSDVSDNTASDVTSTFLIASSSWLLGAYNRTSEKLRHSIGLELELYDIDNGSSTTQEDSLIWLRYTIAVGNKL